MAVMKKDVAAETGGVFASKHILFLFSRNTTFALRFASLRLPAKHDVHGVGGHVANQASNQGKGKDSKAHCRATGKGRIETMRMDKGDLGV